MTVLGAHALNEDRRTMGRKDRAGVVAILAIVALVAFVRSGRATAPPGPTSASTALQNPHMVALGAGICVPCQQMAPILVEARAHYAGRADVDFIDVWEDRDQARLYRYRAIPTQIFYGRDGREVWRNEGYLGHAEIVWQFRRLGVE